MGMIEGTKSLVRPIVLLAMTAGILWGFVMGVISSDQYLVLAGLVIGHWFGTRSMKGA